MPRGGEPKEEQPTPVSPSEPEYFMSGKKPERCGTVRHGIRFT